MVEVVEANFEPVAIYNNQEGKDAKVLMHFGEPAWNYQVTRFLDADGSDIIPCNDRVWTMKGLAKRISEVLKKTNRPVPAALLALTHS
ncbi:hypothetical protein N9B73_06270 [Verrucomicrobiales bacterium]|nr:hypothetical protein [Verrucomicrobiales bacterium]